MWIGERVYFLSDRNGPMTLYRYDPRSKAVSEMVPNTGKDIESASAGPGGIVYEQFGRIYIYDLESRKSQVVPIDIAADLAEVRPHFQNAAREIRNMRISPSGVRAVFEAHGEIITAPAEKGDLRNLTSTPGVMDRAPSWSPDGKSIAWFADESGEYALHLKAQTGEGGTRTIQLAGNSAYYFDPHWSPDSKHIAFTDNQLNLWDVEIASGKLTKVDADYLYELGREFAWSPDSKWIAYEKFLPNRLRAVFLYSLADAKSTQLTDGMSDARFPAFDRDGQYLYFTASTNYGPTPSGLVGISQYPILMDGGQVTAPNFAFFTPDGKWDVENHGVAPDIEVDLDPKAVREGHDPQLERAVAVALDQLKKAPVPEPKRPAYPNYQHVVSAGGGAQ
jgi:tricorn protease